jgi:hypothetical protein
MNEINPLKYLFELFGAASSTLRQEREISAASAFSFARA